MDLASLAATVAAAFSSDPDERRAAEESLTEIQDTPQHLLRILQIIGNGGDGFDISVRQAACIYFKSYIAKRWKSESDDHMISLSDKNDVKRQILELVTQVLPLILRAQMGECLKIIIYADYPQQWPELREWVTNNLRRQQVDEANNLEGQEVDGTLLVLQILASKYKFKSDADRAPINGVIEEACPHLLNMFYIFVHVQNPSLIVADHIKMICKILWSCIYFDLPRPLFNLNVFDAWMDLFLNILVRPVPIEGQPEDPKLRESWGWWKVKKRVAHILNRLYTRFGDPKLQHPDNREFAQMFQMNYSARILECYWGVLKAIHIGEYLPDRVTHLILQYLSNSISRYSLYSLLEPNLNILLYEIVFPLLCFNDNDQMLWDEDPREYVKKVYDTVLYTPRTASMNFVTELVRKRGKDNFPNFMQFIVDIFKQYDEAPLEDKPYRRKDGALLAFGSLRDKLKQNEPYKSKLQDMLVQQVFPEFSSPLGHLRAKAAWVAGQYAVSFSDRANFSEALHRVIFGIRDPELPVRVESALALRSFIDPCNDLDEICPVLTELRDDFFKLMKVVQNEDLAFTLESIVYKFGEKIAPYALSLCQSLADEFWRCINTDKGGDNKANEYGEVAGAGCLRAIATILETISSLPHLYVEIEPLLLPIMEKMLTADGLEVIEEVLEIISYITTFSPSISLEMWRLWPVMMKALVDWAIDFFPNILEPLHNFIYRGTEHYLTCKEPDYQQSLWSVLSVLMANENIYDIDIEPALKLLGIVLQSCKAKVDHWVDPYLKITYHRLQFADKSSTKSLLIEVFANAFYYNATLALGVLQRYCILENVLTLWFQMLKETKTSGEHAYFKREHNKKVCILGLTSLLSLPADVLPEVVIRNVYKALLDLLVAYKDQLAAAKAEEEEDGDDDSETDDEDDDNGDDENQDETDQKLAENEKKDFSEDDDDDDIFDFSDDDFSDDDDDEEDFDSPIDEVDPFIFFMDTVTAMKESDMLRFQSLAETLEPRYQELANNIAKHTELRRAEILKEELEKQQKRPYTIVALRSL